MQDNFDLVVVGTGFASSFFLHAYLANAKPTARILVLERGAVRDHLWHLAHEDELERESQSAIVNRTPDKPWTFKLAFGGGSNCWWACTPRMLPEDFKLRSTYGVGADWPVGYDELEEFYCEAEEIMQVSGPSDGSPYPRSRPYPQPPHRFSDADKLLKRHFADQFFQQPCARPTRATASGRPRCCASGVCNLCPIDSKFTVLNELKAMFADPRVTMRVGASVESLDKSNGAVLGVRYLFEGREQTARGDLVVLGANALFNAHILLRSGLEQRELGRGLVEQAPAAVSVMLDGVDNFSGSTSVTGLGYMLYAGAHRSRRAAGLIESWNVPELRNERGKWRQRLKLKILFEDLRQPGSAVALDASSPSVPAIEFAGVSDYAQKAYAELDRDLERILAPLPVESWKVYRPSKPNEAHILGTTVMGDDAASSVVDRNLVHHGLRNLLVLGGSTFPTAAPANPTLTICALSLRAARRVTSKQ